MQITWLCLWYKMGMSGLINICNQHKFVDKFNKMPFYAYRLLNEILLRYDDQWTAVVAATAKIAAPLSPSPIFIPLKMCVAVFPCGDGIAVPFQLLATTPNHAHPRDFDENKLIVQKKCYYVFKGRKRHYLVKIGVIPSSTFVSISI